MKHYDAVKAGKARELRKAMTPWEIALWNGYLRTHPIRFRRQVPLLGYIADFYCAKARIIVEVDGGGHFTEEQRRHDEARTETFARHGILTMRFTNIEVDRHLDLVCERIDHVLRQRIAR